jgi:regulator of protease activity HflC (stomatin/prohibitin superfamily)
MKSSTTTVNREQFTQVQSGWFFLVFVFLLFVGDIYLLIHAFAGIERFGQPLLFPLALGVLGIPAWIICLTGFFTLQPNEARVLLLFGDYKGTVRESGFHWGNPFYSNGKAGAVAAAAGADGHPKGANLQAVIAAARAGRRGLSRNKISLRARTLNGGQLKVNDKRGNPIEIAAVVIWRVQDTAQAMFDVDDYENYVETQSESALRHIASLYAYDQGEEDEITLRSHVDEVSLALRGELHERFAKAGVQVEEARLTHLAYAPEIAQAMLRRQQAEAVIAARQKIVHGAVSMVDMALKELAEKKVVALDDERRAAMVSNLMVVLCSESEVHPIVNTGTLYT